MAALAPGMNSILRRGFIAGSIVIGTVAPPAALVKQQFGAAIEQVVRETLAQLGVNQANVVVDDKGGSNITASAP
jgi:citrate lyase acyl carrier protein